VVTRRRRLIVALAGALVLVLWPPAAVLAGATPEVQAAPAGGRGSTSSYSVQRVDGHVIRWNPCRAIHYRVNLAHAPKGALGDVKSAVWRVSKATGLKFVYDGSTKQIPQRTYATKLDPTKAKATLVVAWAAPGKGVGHSDLLASDPREVGVGGYRAYSWRRGSAVHRLRILAGFAVLSTKSNGLNGGFGTGPNRGGLLLHELGHAVGLGHVKDKQQIMYPVLTQYASYGAGDLAGLHTVGHASGCIP
jgi:hypothetical protein